MKKLFILCAFLLQFLSPVHSQQATTATIEPNLKYGKPSKEELSLTSYAPDTTATAIYLFHQGQSDFVYHDGFQLTTEHWVRIKILELEKVIPKGNGSNADLNFILISILKDFGLEAYPVVLSRRSSGMLPYNFPSLQKLNTFIVAIYDINKQKYVFLDGSMDVPALNILPLELSVNKARILSPKVKEEKKWVNVMALADNKSFMKIEARMEGNQVKGHRSTILYGQEAVEYQANEKHKQDSIVSTPESNASQKNKLTVTNLKVKKQENDWALIEEEFDFVLQTDQTDSHLYINPMLFPQLKSNPFIQTERVLPIEFPYPYKFTMLTTLTLPEGYEVEETPQPQVIRTQGDGLQCKYMIQRQRNTISLNYIFYLKESIFLTEQYKQLQELWTKVIEKNNALIVLKKL